MSLFKNIAAQFTPERFPIDISPIVAPKITFGTKIQPWMTNPLIKPPTLLGIKQQPVVHPLVKPRFEIKNLFDKIKPVITNPIQNNPVMIATPTVAPIVLPNIKTISFNVSDEVGPLSNPNVFVDGKFVTMGDDNGNVTLPNVSIGSSIKITHVSAKDYQAQADVIPTNVVMTTSTTELDAVKIVRPEKTSKPKETKNNSLLWALGAVVVVVGIKYMKSGNTAVKAKI